MRKIESGTGSTTAVVRSVNVGGVRTVETGGRAVETGIWKTPVEGPVRAEGVNLVGDDQADRTVHGGPDKAIYAFPHEHYPAWRAAYPDADLGFGAFGENLTTEGLLEPDAIIGDRWRCGSVELVVRQPRLPCFKFALRLGAKDAVKRMMTTGECGVYFGIARAGELRAGDALERIEAVDGGLPVSRIFEIYRGDVADAEELRAASEAPALPEEWVTWLRERAERVEG